MWDRLAYISGPYRSDTPEGVKANIETADRAAKWLRSLGWGVICPHKNSEGDDNDEACLAADLTIIDRLSPDMDAMYMLDGWIDSLGAVREYYHAYDRGLTIYRQGTREPPEVK